MTQSERMPLPEVLLKDDNIVWVEGDLTRISWFDQSDHHVVHYRLPEIRSYNQINGANVKYGIVLDVETTGFDAVEDGITEVCALPFTWCPNTFRIGDVGRPFVSLRDPGRPIPDEVVKLTGITDEMVAGKEFDLDGFTRLLDKATLVIAHNATFDRKMVEAMLGHDTHNLWICSLKDVNWTEKFGGISQKLDYLTAIHGFFFDHHRAESDCRATLHLLAHADRVEGTTYFEEAVVAATAPQWRIVCKFSYNEAIAKRLKKAKFEWDPNTKTWHTVVPDFEVQEMESWLELEVFKGSKPWLRTQIDPAKRFQTV